jgi:hypothetical protein
MATNIPAPPTRAGTKGESPVRVETRGNLAKPEPTSAVALNFRVPAAFKKDFKIAAATHGVTQSDLLQQAFVAWRQRHG